LLVDDDDDDVVVVDIVFVDDDDEEEEEKDKLLLLLMMTTTMIIGLLCKSVWHIGSGIYHQIAGTNRAHLPAQYRIGYCSTTHRIYYFYL
jgi:hypothetical protein